MIDGKKILAIIPARGGSIRIPGKNIVKLCGKPLLEWTVEEAKKSKYIDRLILSSENQEIIDLGKQLGCEVPFIRPLQLASDDARSIDVIIHALKSLSEKFDFVCILQPTSPLRTVEDIDGCIEKCINKNSTSCLAIKKVLKSPEWMFQLNEKGDIKPLFPKKSSLRSQDLDDYYIPNGAVYFVKVKDLIKYKKLMFRNSSGFLMDDSHSVDIDVVNDLLLAEIFMRKRLQNES